MQLRLNDYTRPYLVADSRCGQTYRDIDLNDLLLFKMIEHLEHKGLSKFDLLLLSCSQPKPTTMKIGNPYPGIEVGLPLEVMAVIAALVDLREPNLARQRDLHACCLVSKPWYSATIRHLYRAPYLSTTNFDLFTRTICPPVSSQVRAVALESFVRVLDLTDIAYQSSRSLTARLLRRTGRMLESLTAPNISLSVASLAPLSKMYRLRRLDLVQNYNVDLRGVMSAIHILPYLSYLALHSGALRTYLSSLDVVDQLWPPGLVHLVVCGEIILRSIDWNRLFSALPCCTQMLTLGLVRKNDNSMLRALATGMAPTDKITSLRVVHDRGTIAYIHVICEDVFPRLQHLSLSCDDDTMYRLWSYSRDGTVIPTTLKRLSLTEDPASQESVSATIGPAALRGIVDLFPRLVHLDMPERFLTMNEVTRGAAVEELAALQKEFERRSREYAASGTATGLRLHGPVSSDDSVRFLPAYWKWVYE